MNAVPDTRPAAPDAPEFVPFEAANAARTRPPALAPDAGALLRFRSLMAADGQPVQLARLCVDTHYAYERIAAAHASGDAALRRLALELFQIWHRRAAGLPAQ